jgi:hypothetical protein
MQNKRRQKQESTYHAKQIPVLLLMPGGVSCDRGFDTPSKKVLDPRIANRRRKQKNERNAQEKCKLRLEQWKSLSYLFDSFWVLLSNGF